jgi:hypothetical protein
MLVPLELAGQYVLGPDLRLVEVQDPDLHPEVRVASWQNERIVSGKIFEKNKKRLRRIN